MRAATSRADVLVMTMVLSSGGEAVAGPPRLDLVWVDPAGIAEGSYPTIAAESRAVLASLGAEVAWTAPPPGAVLGPESLAVIAVPTYRARRSRDRHVMGATQAISDDALAVWVFPEQVAWVLGLRLDLRSSWERRSEERFARALGRVVSHEIVHALGATAHARAGLMAASLNRDALTAPVLRIDPATVASVRRAFDRRGLAAAGVWPHGPRDGSELTPAPEPMAASPPAR